MPSTTSSDDAHTDDTGDEEHQHGGPENVLSRRGMLGRVAYVAAGTAVGLTVGACSAATTGSPSAQTTPPGSAPGTTRAGAGSTVPSPTEPRPDTPAQVLEALKAGNARFVSSTPIHPNQSAELRESVTETQNPFVGILTCADSRVVPELIFDQGLSDVFTVRVAGNIADPAGVASLVYAVEVLGVDVVTVMGHTNCGAVKAAIDVSDGKMQAGEFAPLTDAITPAVEVAKPTSNSGDQLLKTIEANVKVQTDKLIAASPALAAAIKEGRLTVAGSMYDLGSGKVTYLS